jgi:hypothetical protein
MSSAPPPPIPPSPLNYATPMPQVDLRKIAFQQKAIMYCILAYIAVGVLRFVLPPGLQLMVLVPLGLAAVITAAVFVFMLAISLHNIAAGITLGILTLIPLVGLVVLLIINSTATKLLQSHGIKVGLMGADLNQIPPAGPPSFGP